MQKQNRMNGIELIAKERQEQIDKHGISVENDATYNKAYQLTEAAAILATELFPSPRKRFAAMPSDWNDKQCLKMANKPRFQRLAIAGALIAAELDKILALDKKEKELNE
jgi:hypothetical protein